MAEKKLSWTAMNDLGKCEAGEWENLTGQTGQCPNDATHTEYWFDEEGLEVVMCDEHERS